MEKESISKLFQEEVTIIPLRGFIKNNDYQRAKTPITPQWNRDSGLDSLGIDRHLEKGGWLGLVIPKGFILVDIDDKENGAFLWNLLKRLKIKSLVMETPNGWQFFFKDTGKAKTQSTKILTKGLFTVDYRLAGKGYTVLPTDSTRGRMWRELSDGEIDDLPLFLEPLKQTEEFYRFPIPIGNRNDTIFRHACRLRDYIRDEKEIKEICLFINRYLTEEPLPDKELLKTIEKREGYEYKIKENNIRLTDIWNSENFVKKYKGSILWVSQWGRWLVYRDGKWVRDNLEETVRLGKELILGYYEMVEDIKNEEERKRLIKHILKSESENRILSMLELSKPDLAISPEAFDRDPFVLNLKNGTFDLKTMEFRAHDSKELLTKQMNARYNPVASCPRWIEFLNLIFREDQETITFVQKALGYSLTGDTGEECIFLLWGSGQNGKTTFLNTLLDVFGDYGVVSPVSAFLLKDGDHIPNDIARLVGSRFVIGSEAPEGREFNATLVKSLTGRDRIAARFLRQEFFEFTPTCKIWLAMNHKPIVKETSIAFWRRIRLIPFTYTIPDEKKQPNYERKLLEERDGILNWMIEGFKRWREEGLGQPSAISSATAEYKTEMDIIGAFITDRCIDDKYGEVLMKELYGEYLKWCEENGERPMSQKSFSIRLEEKGYRKVRIKTGRLWQGIRLRNTMDQDIMEIEL